jgi:hypothetical protein
MPREKKQRYLQNSQEGEEVQPEYSEFQQPTVVPPKEYRDPEHITQYPADNPPAEHYHPAEHHHPSEHFTQATSVAHGEPKTWDLSVSGLSEHEPAVYVMQETQKPPSLGLFGIFSAIAKGCIQMNPDLNKVTKR